MLRRELRQGTCSPGALRECVGWFGWPSGQVRCCQLHLHLHLHLHLRAARRQSGRAAAKTHRGLHRASWSACLYLSSLQQRKGTSGSLGSAALRLGPVRMRRQARWG